MVKALSPHLHNNMDQLAPSTLFNILATHCFLEEIKNPAADSLRRLLKEMNKVNGIYRNTPEWDNLISL